MSSGSPSSQASKPGRGEQVVELHRERRTAPSAGRTRRGRARRPSRRAASGSAGSAPARSRSLPGLPRASRGCFDEQDVLAALDRIGVDAEQRQQARRRGRDPLAQRSASSRIGRRRCGERLEDRHRQAGAAAGRVDGEVGRVAQALGSARRPGPSRPSPFCQSSACCAANASRRHALAGAASSSSTHGRKSAGARSGKVSSRLREVALRDRSRSPGCRRSRPPRAAPMQSPVLPLPVMPTHTACVTRSLES